MSDRSKHGKAATSGFKDAKLDYFSDVAKALTAHLMETDPVFRKASISARNRNLASKARKASEAMEFKESSPI